MKEANQAAGALKQAGFQAGDIQTIGFHPASQQGTNDDGAGQGAEGDG